MRREVLKLSARSRVGEGVVAPRDSSAGFTLIELTVAMVILTVGLVGVAGLMASAIQRQLRASSRIEMTTLAESKTEELRAYAMLGAADTTQVSVGGSLTTFEADHSETQEGPSGQAYNLRWTVAAGPAGTRAVTVRVTPANRTLSVVRSLTLDALVLVVR